MTFLEKAKQDHNISNEDHMIQDLCPCDLGYEAKIKCKAIIGADEKDKAYVCRRCWEREMPSIEPEEDISIVDQVMDAYNDGLNDAWELARKLYADIPCDVLGKLFDTEEPADVIDYFTPQEAFAKLKVYEDSKIEAGDVVKVCVEKNPFVILAVYRDKIYGYKIGTSINPLQDLTTVEMKKTGKHIDIQSILNQIGE